MQQKKWYLAAGETQIVEMPVVIENPIFGMVEKMLICMKQKFH